MVIRPAVIKYLRNYCNSSGLVTDVSVGDSSGPLSSPEDLWRKPKPKKRHCWSSVAFWVIGTVCEVIVVFGNERASGLPLSRDLGNPVYFRGAKASYISGPQWAMVDKDLVSKEGSFACFPTQDITTSPESLHLEGEPCSLKRRHQLTLKISTFNLLAPCYKRVAPAHQVTSCAGTPSSRAHRMPFSLGDRKWNSFDCILDTLKSKTTRSPKAYQLKSAFTYLSGGGNSIGANLHFSRESEFHNLWHARAQELVDFIQDNLVPECDIMCFQEWWFDPGFEKIFQSKLLDHFSFHTYQRTGYKMDGLAILLKKGEGEWKVIASSRYSLGRIGNRVALLLHLHREEGKSFSSPPQEVILCNTHLSFPHSQFDRALQKKQVERLVDAIEGYVEEQGLSNETPRIVCGDFNLEESDVACNTLRNAGYISTHSCKVHEEGDSQMVTHHTHRGEQVRVDHVWVKAQALVTSSGEESATRVRELTLIPRNMDSRYWCDEFQLSDHRPLYACINIDITKPQ